MTWLAVVLSLVGNVGVIRKRRWGFSCWVCANAIWIADALGRADAQQTLLWGVYLALALCGWVRWSAEGVDE